VSLRTATASDLAGIMALERDAFPTDAWSESMMAAEIASPHGRYVVDVDAGVLRGYGGVRAVQGAADADIQTIAIAAAARGRGRGRALLAELLTTARARGARDVFLEVRADNPVASTLYASVGFVEIARRPRYYQPDDVDAVVMKLDLAAWEAARADSAERTDTAERTGAATGVTGEGWC
jgi:ribosomal-protein-alanine N-acetyltransferase